MRFHELILSFPVGYETWIGERGYNLSGGERQLLEVLYSIMDARSTLVITHRLVGLEAMDEILVLDDGKVVEQRSHQELLQAKGLYKRMWDPQNQVLGG